MLSGNVYGGVATPLAMLHGSEAPPRRIVRPLMNENSRREQRLPALREAHSDNSGHRRPECEPLLPISNSVMKILPNPNAGKFNYPNNFNEPPYNNGISVNYNFNNSNPVKPFDTPKSKLGHFDNLNCGNNFSGNNSSSNSNKNNISGNSSNGMQYGQNGHSNKGNGFFNIGLNGLILQSNTLEDNPLPPLPVHKPYKNQQPSGSR